MTRALQNTLSLMVLKVSVEDETGVSGGGGGGEEAMNLKETKKRYMGRFGERKEKGEMT